MKLKSTSYDVQHINVNGQDIQVLTKPSHDYMGRPFQRLIATRNDKGLVWVHKDFRK